jgi:hypothetical protein
MHGASPYISICNAIESAACRAPHTVTMAASLASKASKQEPAAILVFTCDAEFAWARKALSGGEFSLLAPYEPTDRKVYGYGLVAMRTVYKKEETPLLIVRAENMGARGIYGLARNLPKGVPVVLCGGAASINAPLGSVMGVESARDLTESGFDTSMEYDNGGAGRFYRDHQMHLDRFTRHGLSSTLAASTNSIVIKDALVPSFPSRRAAPSYVASGTTPTPPKTTTRRCGARWWYGAPPCMRSPLHSTWWT